MVQVKYQDVSKGMTSQELAALAAHRFTERFSGIQHFVTDEGDGYTLLCIVDEYDVCVISLGEFCLMGTVNAEETLGDRGRDVELFSEVEDAVTTLLTENLVSWEDQVWHEVNVLGIELQRK